VAARPLRPPGVGAHTYDGRNRVASVAGGSARGYDPTNKKIWWKDAQGNLYVDFYGPGGKLGTYWPFMPSSGSAVPLFERVAEYTYFAGRLVKGEGPWTNGWVQQDRLGSAVTHLPYGDERTVTAQGLLKFATYWREDSGVDYADQRYYSSTYGRFLTSDPYRASGGPSDPGSWNRYAYVQGDPVNLNDPEGLAGQCIDRPFSAQEFLMNGNVFCPPTVKTPLGANYSVEQRAALSTGFDGAYDRLSTKWDCLTLLGAGYTGGYDTHSAWGVAFMMEAVRSAMENTEYRILPLASRAIGAQTNIETSVFINSNGAFFAVQPDSQGLVRFSIPGVGGDGFEQITTTLSGFRAFILLHELGHQMRVFGSDAAPPGANEDARQIVLEKTRANSLSVLSKCFTKSANGVYQ